MDSKERIAPARTSVPCEKCADVEAQRPTKYLEYRFAHGWEPLFHIYRSPKRGVSRRDSQRARCVLSLLGLLAIIVIFGIVCRRLGYPEVLAPLSMPDLEALSERTKA